MASMAYRRQNRSNQRLIARGDGELLVSVGFDDVAVLAQVGVDDIGILFAGVLLDEVIHVEDTSHPTGIITKEDTTERCEGNEQVGAKGDRGFDAVDIGRARHGHDTASRHLE